MKIFPFYKRFLILASFFIIIGILLVLSYSHHTSSYTIPISKNDVNSIAFYYENIAQKKIITESTDIASILDNLNNLSADGSYEKVPSGGQTFFLIFDLENGSKYTCTYYQTEKSSGFYADQSIKTKVSNLNLQELWLSMQYQEIQAIAENEVNPPAI